MNVDHIGGAVTSTPVSIICFIVAFLTFAAIFGVKPFLKKQKVDMSGNLQIVMLVFIVIVAALSGVQHNLRLEDKVDEKAFAEQLKNDYGVTTVAGFSEVLRSATYEQVVVFTDEKGDFEVRPHLDGTRLTFFRNDNNAQVKRLDS